MELKIKSARRAAGLTQEEMSKKYDIPLSTIKKWDAGISSPPKWAEKLLVEKLKEEVNMLSEKKKDEILKKGTNMTNNDIKKHLQNGASFYTNDEDGYKAYWDECIAGLNDAEDIPGMWNSLDVIGDYRVDFIA